MNKIERVGRKGLKGAIFAVLLSMLTGCEAFQYGAVPSSVEQALYTTITNYVEVPITRTYTTHQTNTVTQYITNTVGQIVTVTNTFTLPKYEIVTETNLIPVYEHQVSDRTRAIVQTGGGILNTFFPGAGQAASLGVLALLGAWGHWRSSKRGKASAALSQEVETILEFIKALPNGAAYKEAIVGWLQAHQVEQGIANQVLELLEKRVDNPAAKVAVNEIQAVLEALQVNAKQR